MPEGSTVRVWGINKKDGGNWELHDSYIVPAAPQAPEAPKATNTVVDIAVGLDEGDTVVTKAGVTSADVAFNYGGEKTDTINWGSPQNPRQPIGVDLKGVDSIEVADVGETVKFGTMTHRNYVSRAATQPREPIKVIGSVTVTVEGKSEIVNDVELADLYFYETGNTSSTLTSDDFFVLVPTNQVVTVGGNQYVLSVGRMVNDTVQDHEANRQELFSLNRQGGAAGINAGNYSAPLRAFMESDRANDSDVSYVRSLENKDNIFDFMVSVTPLNINTGAATIEGEKATLPEEYSGAVPTEAGATWKSKTGGNVDVADNGNGSFTVSKAGQVLGEFSGDTNGNYSFKPAAGVKSLADNDVATTTFQFGDKHEVTFNLNAMSYDEYAALPNTKKVDSVYKVTEGDNLDFAAIGNNAEVIDLGSVSAKLSNISSAEVKAHTQGSLYIRGQADDTIDLDGWTKGAATQATTLVADNNTYDTYTSGDATLYIQQGINVV